MSCGDHKYHTKVRVSAEHWCVSTVQQGSTSWKTMILIFIGVKKKNHSSFKKAINLGTDTGA